LPHDTWKGTRWMEESFMATASNSHRLVIEKIVEGQRLSSGLLEDTVRSLVLQYLGLWWECGSSFPDLGTDHNRTKQLNSERMLRNLINALIHELDQIPQSQEGQKELQSRLRSGLMTFASDALHINPALLEFIESSGMLDAELEFARMARRFDPQISAEDIYQAGRNVMTANFIQLLMDNPVEVTPSIFAYSMLYPYTDNYLDDPNIPPEVKSSYNNRFYCRLHGEDVQPLNPNETTIFRLVEMIESQWDREQSPGVYESLYCIYTAQVRSLGLIRQGALPYEMDVLGISFEKGGASVLADGYLVAGNLTPEQSSYLFGYGAFTQLMDDMEDIEEDMRQGRMTIFSQAANKWPLDNLTNRLFHFGRVILDDLSVFHSKSTDSLKELINTGVDPILIDIVGRFGKYYSTAYLQKMDQYATIRFKVVHKQRQKLDRKKVKLGKIIDVML
jgi:hypothetical protein